MCDRQTDRWTGDRAIVFFLFSVTYTAYHVCVIGFEPAIEIN